MSLHRIRPAALRNLWGNLLSGCISKLLLQLRYSGYCLRPGLVKLHLDKLPGLVSLCVIPTLALPAHVDAPDSVVLLPRSVKHSLPLLYPFAHFDEPGICPTAIALVTKSFALRAL